MMIFACCSTFLSAQHTGALQVKEFKLNNGLTVWLNEDHTQPKVFGAVVVKAGAKDCPDTGIAHYFEHMMFKGTDKLGTVNYKEEKVLLDSIAARYDVLAATEDVKQREQIQKEINRLSVRASAYVIPNEFNKLITRYGGSGLNAATSYDATIYYNTFSPQYMEQWAEINSERLVNPVFRMFQSELETVYEEKNMYGDFIGGQVVEKLLARYFAPHPYAYPIIGSTKNLKNPRLTEMRKFFEEYYVASNMGLILSGDFETQTVLPILEKTFSRIRQGEAPQKSVVPLPPFRGKEKMKVKFPIPFLKIMGLGFRGVPANHEDKVALNVVVNLLNNNNGTGYLDKLMVDHKVMASMALNESMNEAGILAVAVVPKLLVQSYASAEKLVWREINRIKEGDFSDEVFNSLKLEQKRMYASALGNIDSRATVMMNLFSQGKSWKDYLEEIARIEAMTKEDVRKAACKYFNENHLCVTKKTGKYKKDQLPKPDFAPVVPSHAEMVSEYAKKLDSIPVRQVHPRMIDFDKDVRITSLTPWVDLYTVENPLNDIFAVTISFEAGTLEYPALKEAVVYLPLLGTDSLSFETFRSRLQALGSSLTFDVDEQTFTVQISGFDPYFKETMKLAGDFLRHAKADDKKLRQVADDAKVTRKAFFKSNDNVALAALERVKFGDKSRFLNHLSLSEIKKLKGKDLVEVFDTVRRTECSIHYCGALPIAEVSTWVKECLPLDEVRVASRTPVYRELESYEKPVVYFVNMPDVSQSIVLGYVKGREAEDDRSRYASRLFSVYFGGDMSSLMFQEIREFRSFAYRAHGRYSLPPKIRKGKAGDFVAMLSTQSDKTCEALSVLDSLIRKMPVKEERWDAIKQSVINQVNNDYPSFRDISKKVARYRKEGFNEDPAKGLLQGIEEMGMEDIVHFYNEQVQGRPIVYVIVGNDKRMDVNKLSSFGTVVRMKMKDIYR